jgi:2-polyprenyl-3-methyl-5-hydroxy-6-metoxy-1,4-benzoquinol methylase
MDFYDRLAPFYPIIYGDWDTAIVQQAVQLSAIVRSQWGTQIETILDVSCGIGTQALGLAVQGYQVAASDLSRQAIDRAQKEARIRNLYQIQKLMRQIRSPLAPLQKGGTGVKVPLLKGDLGGSPCVAIKD